MPNGRLGRGVQLSGPRFTGKGRGAFEGPSRPGISKGEASSGANPSKLGASKKKGARQRGKRQSGPKEKPELGKKKSFQPCLSKEGGREGYVTPMPPSLPIG